VDNLRRTPAGWPHLHANGGLQEAERTAYVHDGQQIVLAFYKGTSGNAALTNRFSWSDMVDHLLADEQVTILSVAGTTHWALENQINSIVDLVTYNAGTNTTSVVKHRQFDSFGNIVSDSAPGVSEIFAFTGKMFDATIGLQWNINRWYDPLIGQWISEDPIGFAGDTNLHRYVFNSPTNATDPTGLITVFFHGYGGPSGSGRSSGSVGSSSGSTSSSPGGSSESSESSEGSSASCGSHSSQRGGSSDSGQGSGDSSKPGGSSTSLGSSGSHGEKDDMVKLPERYAPWRGDWGAAGTVHHYAYNEVDKAVDDIIAAVGPPDSRKEPIVLIGHSWGGDAALAAARKLNSRGYKVDMLATVDAVTDTLAGSLWSTPTTRRPPNVETVWNWYQTNTSPYGCSIPKADLNEHWNKDGSLTDDSGYALGHRGIDDNAAIRDKIRAKAMEIHERFRKR
jgi:RHS repeat-associated protein